MADRHRRSRAPSPAVGAALTMRCMSATVMSWQLTPAMTGATNRSHSRRWVSACLRDHGRPTGCRSGYRYQAIRSAPGRSRSGASACSRSVTLASLAASLSSVTASPDRRRPFSFNTARHRSPARLRRVHRDPALQPPPPHGRHRGRTRALSPAREPGRARRGTSCPPPAAAGPPGTGRLCWISVWILDSDGADCAMGIPLFLRFAQVRGLTERPRGGGQGQGRTADLPLFRRTLIPTELPDLVGTPVKSHRGSLRS